ncbi:MAG: sulfatase [Armatimonadota bacterium]
MRLKIKTQWLQPFLSALSLAVLLGTPAGYIVLREQHYLQFRLYYNALLSLTGAIDRLVPLTIGVVLCVILLSRQSRASEKKERIAGVVLFVLIACLATAYAWFIFRTPIQTVLANSPALVQSLLPLLRAAGRLLITVPGLCTLAAASALALVVYMRKRERKAMAASISRPPRRPGTRMGWAVRGLCWCLTLAFLALNLTAGAFWLRNAATLRGKPNIIFIMVDTLRADHLGCYGYDLDTTPHIDAFARESTRFEQAMAQAPWTGWSMASFLSSRFPNAIFPELEETAHLYFSQYYPTLPEALREQGYTTHAIVSNPWVATGSGYEQGYDRYLDSPTAIMKEHAHPTSPSVTGLAVQQLRALKGKPFFLFLLYFDPHGPYAMRKGYEFGESRLDRMSREIFGTRMVEETQQVRSTLHRRYNSEIGYTDAHVGLLLGELKRQGLYDDAMIVLFSDHGEQFVEHGNFGHALSLHAEEVQVPFIVKMPRQREGRVVKGTFPLIDLYPSLMGYLHADTSALGLQGDTVDLDSVLRCADKPIFSATIFSQRSVLQGRYRYIERNLEGKAQARELFDIVNDPWEQRNIVGQHRQLIDGLQRQLDQRDDHRLATDIVTQQATATAMKSAHIEGMLPQNRDAAVERLRALGYLQ